MFNGQGKLMFPDKSTYEGEFQNDFMHGFGKFTQYNERLQTDMTIEGFFYLGQFLGDS